MGRQALRGARGASLLEVAVATGLTGLVAGLALELLVGTQRQVTAAASLQRATGESRRIAHRLAAELHGLNLSPLDLQPSAPFQETALAYRVVRGYDAANHRALLDPPRASGAFRALSLVGDEVVLEVPGVGPVSLARGIGDLRFTLVAPNKLSIAVTAVAGDGEGGQVTRAVELTIALTNTLEDAE